GGVCGEVAVTCRVLGVGGEARVPLVDGEDEIRIPAGTQPGARFKLRGKGMPNVSGRGHGDLYVVARAAVPKKLTKDQRRLLEELAKTMPQESIEPGSAEGGEKPFFEKVKDIFG